MRDLALESSLSSSWNARGGSTIDASTATNLEVGCSSRLGSCSCVRMLLLPLLEWVPSDGPKSWPEEQPQVGPQEARPPGPLPWLPGWAKVAAAQLQPQRAVPAALPADLRRSLGAPAAVPRWEGSPCHGHGSRRPSSWASTQSPTWRTRNRSWCPKGSATLVAVLAPLGCPGRPLPAQAALAGRAAAAVGVAAVEVAAAA